MKRGLWFVVFVLVLVTMGHLSAWDLDEVTVTGTRVEKRLADTPVVTEVISASEIQSSGASDLESLLKVYGVITNEDTTHGDQINLQGLGGGRVLVLIDGRRVAGRLAGDVEGDSIPLVNVDRVEIVRGPQSALYGSDAMGGVINIITKKPGKSGFSLRLENTSLPAYDDPALNGKGTVAAPFQNQLAEVGFDMPLGGWSTSWNLLGSRSDYYWDQKAEVSILPQLYRGSASVEAVRGSQADGSWTVGGSFTALNQTDQTDFTGSLDQHDLQRAEAHVRFQRATDAGSWDVQAYQQWYRRGSSSYVAGTNLWTIDDPQLEGLSSAEVWYTRDLTESNILTAGIQSSVDILHDPDLSTGSLVVSDSEAVVLQDEQYQEGRYSVITGLRLEHGAGWGLFAAPKISAQYTLIPGLRLLGGTGIGYRVPSVEDRYTDIDWSWHPIVLGNPDLKPEYSVAANAGIEWVPNTILSSRVNAYHQELFDEIEYVDVDVAPDGRAIYRNENRSRTARTGVDVELAVSPLPEWTIDGTFQGMLAVDRETGEILTDNREVLTDNPSRSFRVSIRYSKKAWGLSVNLGGRWDSMRQLFIFDGGLSKGWKNGLEVYARGENLSSVLDKADGPFTPVSLALGLRYHT